MSKKKSSKGNPATLHEFRSMGGKARAAALTKAKRKAIAKKGAEARWNGKTK